MRMPLLAVVLALTACPESKPKEPPPGKQFAPAVLSAKRVVAHAIDGVRVGALPEGGVLFEQFVSVKHRELTAAELARLNALIDSGAISSKRDPPLPCPFNGHFGLEWISDEGSARALFGFDCGDVVGSSGIYTYDLQKVAAFAHDVFPERR